MTANRRVTSATKLLFTLCAATTIAHADAKNTLHSQSSTTHTAAASTLPGVVALMADSIANAGDSLAAYAMLDSALHVNKHDAAAWDKYAMMAWSMARSSRNRTINHSQFPRVAPAKDVTVESMLLDLGKAKAGGVQTQRGSDGCCQRSENDSRNNVSCRELKQKRSCNCHAS